VVTDLAELNLPMFDEPNYPRLHQYVHQHTKDWSAIVQASAAMLDELARWTEALRPLRSS
jgi:NAD(P)H-dependent FMN reductase